MSLVRNLLLGLALSTGAALCGAEPEPAPATPEQIRTLLDELVSPNPKPITGREEKRVGPEYKLPEGFDRKKQERVHAARAKLKQLGPVAFPFLIERWSDERYCLTKSNGISGYCYNASVGDVCRDVLFNQLQPYSFWPILDDDPRGKPKRPSYPNAHLGTAADAVKWHQKHKGKTLHQLQVMVIDWVIEQESKRPADFTDKERAELKGIRDELLKSGKPIDRGNYLGDDIEE
jgi:hypothetical protein